MVEAMKLFSADKKDVIKKIRLEYNCDSIAAERKFSNLTRMSENAAPFFEAWFKGEFLDHTVGDVSISYIMEKLDCNYLDAITWMDHFIQHPEKVASFKDRDFDRR